MIVWGPLLYQLDLGSHPNGASGGKGNRSVPCPRESPARPFISVSETNGKHDACLPLKVSIFDFFFYI